jgi:hypothetical protein
MSEQFQNPLGKIVDTGKIDTLNTQMHDRSLSWLKTGNSMNI